MGSNCCSCIAYGYRVKYVSSLPWVKAEMDLDDWWREKCGWVEPEDSPYTTDGNRKPHLKSLSNTEFYKATDPYYERLNEFDKNHPIPFELVYCGSGYSDWVEVILAVAEISADWDSAESICPSDLKFDVVKADALERFVQSHEIEDIEGPGWWLGAYYG